MSTCSGQLIDFYEAKAWQSSWWTKHSLNKVLIRYMCVHLPSVCSVLLNFNLVDSVIPTLKPVNDGYLKHLIHFWMILRLKKFFPTSVMLIYIFSIFVYPMFLVLYLFPPWCRWRGRLFIQGTWHSLLSCMESKYTSHSPTYYMTPTWLVFPN